MKIVTGFGLNVKYWMAVTYAKLSCNYDITDYWVHFII